jgi:K+-transporting ATPase ATPase A chain
MTTNGLLQFVLYFLVLLVLTKPLGVYMARVFEGEPTLAGKILGPVERLIYHLCRVDEKREQSWVTYTAAMLIFNLAGLLLTYLLQRVQYYLPLNPQGFSGVAPDLAFNTAVSFTTNTNWQAYSGEAVMSYFTQMAALAFHNFVSAATGLALAIAFIRGIARRQAKTLGNFWVDLTRATLYILLPLSFIGALFLVSQGVVQNFSPYTRVKLVEPFQVETQNEDGTTTTETISEQVIAQGPVASQEMI